MNFQIKKYKRKYKNQIISVWEKSVLATHHFLSPTDYIEIRDLLQDYDFSILDMFCLTDEDTIIGFIGLHNSKIEMLFLDPTYIGKGLGKQLIQFATSKRGATLVDVNEQNISAKNFYEKLGFVTYERTEKDDFGKDYPLLRMKLITI
ncbi:GNAT family N-acetyltransferase [Pedobacter xixiisoli]|uniref:Putative acetyltransferase n=1 Tax=Pedobacter xixiisoli TaxID=1476464 RepID=A0A285ZQD8_9SPHI|nr:GNAT family N-acetyltransferase [Pedobacter xixiisoli]SOD11873.1 putative acetyltransferase [Pedobacter xixiisoli]